MSGWIVVVQPIRFEVDDFGLRQHTVAMAALPSIDAGTVVQIVKDCVTMVASATGLFFAWLGLRTWRRQLVGQAEYELARRWIRVSYQVKEAFRRLRSPLQTGAEIASALERFKSKGDTIENSAYVKEVAVYEARWERFSEVFISFEGESLEAEVMWGDSARDLRKPIQELAREMYKNIVGHCESQKERIGAGTDRQTVDAVIYGFGDYSEQGKDVFGDRIVASVRELEKFCRKHLRK